MSSRNVYLDQTQRKDALLLSKSLYTAASLIAKDERDAKTIKNKIHEVMENLDVEYVAIVDREFNEIQTVELNNCIILIVVRFGNTRLLDNIWL